MGQSGQAPSAGSARRRAVLVLSAMTVAIVATLPLGKPAPAVAAGAPASLTLKLDLDTLPADGKSREDIRATVVDADNNPVANDSVTFSTDGDMTFESNPVTTGSNGVAFTHLIASTTPGTETITATEAVAGNSDSKMVTEASTSTTTTTTTTSTTTTTIHLSTTSSTSSSTTTTTPTSVNPDPTPPGWHSFENLGQPPGGLTSAPDVASWEQGRLDAFGRGNDGALWHRWFDGSWHPWESLGGQLVGGPTAVSWSLFRLDVFVHGGDHHLWHKWWDGSAWRGFEDLGMPASGLASDPDVASWSDGRLDVFAAGSDHALWHKWWDGTAWRGWESRGAPPGQTVAFDPGAVSWGSNRVDVFVAGSNDHHLWHSWWDRTAWSSFEDLGAPAGGLTTGVDVASWQWGRLDVFGGADYNQGTALFHTWFNGASWAGWEGLGGGLASGDEPAAASWAPDRVDTFLRGNDSPSNLWHKWYQG